MTRNIFMTLCLAVSLLGCAELLNLDAFEGADTTTGTGGNAGEGGTGIGGDAGEGGQGGDGGNTGGTGGNTGGTGGQGGQGGQGGDPCTGKYIVLASIGPNSLNSNAGTTTTATFDVYGTSPGDELSVSAILVNDPVANGDFTGTPVDTSVADYVRLRAQDPNGGPIFNEVCNLSLTLGQAVCPAFLVYSASSGVTQIQIQIKPTPGQAGTIRIGFKPSSVPLCGDQLTIPIVTIFQSANAKAKEDAA